MDQNERQSLARETMRILNDWQVPPELQVILLGLPENTKPRALNRFRAGEDIFAEDEQTLKRLSCIIGMSQALQSAFPHNPDMARYWATSPSRFLGDRTPLDIMVSHGLEGMQNLLDQLNGDHSW
ncbi:MAG: DUF2384 domain-containing protein [Granulosicoccaceae bacterium]|jgi:uncharacterized protein (DUF2384 family)